MDDEDPGDESPVTALAALKPTRTRPEPLLADHARDDIDEGPTNVKPNPATIVPQLFDDDPHERATEVRKAPLPESAVAALNAATGAGRDPESTATADLPAVVAGSAPPPSPQPPQPPPPAPPPEPTFAAMAARSPAAAVMFGSAGAPLTPSPPSPPSPGEYSMSAELPRVPVPVVEQRPAIDEAPREVRVVSVTGAVLAAALATAVVVAALFLVAALLVSRDYIVTFTPRASLPAARPEAERATPVTPAGAPSTPQPSAVAATTASTAAPSASSAGASTASTSTPSGSSSVVWKDLPPEKGARPSMRAVYDMMAKLRPALRACNTPIARYPFTVEFEGATGHARRVELPSSLVNHASAACLQREALAARVPPFAGAKAALVLTMTP